MNLGDEPRRSRPKRPEGQLQYLQVERISTLVRKYNWELFPHQHGDLFQVAVLESGEGRAHLDIEVAEIGAGAVVVLPPRTMHHFELGKHAEMRMMTVEASYFLSQVKQVSGPEVEAALLHPQVVRFERQDESWRALQSSFENIDLHQSLSRRRARAAILTANLLAVLSLLADHLPGDVPTVEADNQIRLYLSFRRMLESNFDRHLGVARYATDLSVTEQSLYRACKAVSGLSPSKLVQQRLLLEAQRLLLYTEQSVTQVAYTLGFSDPSTFSRFFTDRMGQSPATFRRIRMG